MNMKSLGVVITDGVGFRNFILTDFIHEAKQKFDKVVILSCLPKFVYDDFNLDCEIIELQVFKEDFKTWFFRKAKDVAHLQLYKKGNFGIQDNLNINRTEVKSNRGYATRLIYSFTSIFHSEKWIQRLYYCQQLTFKYSALSKEYQTILKEQNFDLLFFTHQRPTFIAPLIAAAEQLKIKTTAFIFSWDNLASKGRMAGNFDTYLVWSDLMKQELMFFYKAIQAKDINVVGTPQFEPFASEKFGYSKEQLISKFKLDSNKPIIVFTCNDSTSKNDPIYLDVLARFMEEKKLVKEVNLIVRTSPAEDPDRFRHLIDKYPFIVWNFPDWTVKRKNHGESWSQRVPSKEDLDDLKSMLKHCDFNINVLSTITLDSFIFDKPVINPVFGTKENGMYDDQRFFNYEHLSKLVDSNASQIAKNEDEFLIALNNLLNFKDHKKAERTNFLTLQIGKPLEGTSKRIAEALLKWA